MSRAIRICRRNHLAIAPWNSWIQAKTITTQKRVRQFPLLVSMIELLQVNVICSNLQLPLVEEVVMDWSVSVTVQFFSVNHLFLVWNSMFGNSFYLTWPRTSQTLTMTSWASNTSFNPKLSYLYKTMRSQVLGQTRAKGYTWYSPWLFSTSITDRLTRRRHERIVISRLERWL